MPDSRKPDTKESGTIFLLAENRLLRETLSRLLRRKSGLSVVGEAGRIEGVIHRIAAASSEILILDNSTSSREDFNFILEVMEAIPDLRIILIGVDDDEEGFLNAARCGVVGYLLREASAMDVIATVRAVARGEAVCPPQLVLSLFRCIAKQAKDSSHFRARAKLSLTRRQQQLVSLVAKGCTNKEIASTLNLSEQTVKNHMHRILRQVDAEDRYEAVETIRSVGLLS